MRRIFKVKTGDEVPEDAIYLNTIAQTEEYNQFANDRKEKYVKCYHIWHYFLTGKESPTELPPPNDGEIVTKGG